MVEFLSRTLRCPICNTGFLVEVPVGVAPVATETDFRPVFTGPDPVAADIAACPRCRYAGYSIAFESEPAEEGEEPDRPGVPPPVEPLALGEEDDLDDLRRWIRRGELVEGTDLANREPLAAERYLLAARCRDFLLGGEPLPLADLYLRGAWCARSAKRPDLERALLLEAVDQFDAALDEGKVPGPLKGRILYLTAELARRAGDFAHAVDLFGQVEGQVDLDEEEGLRLYRLSRRMESLASIQSAVPATMPSDEELEATAGPDDAGHRRDDGDEDEEDEA